MRYLQEKGNEIGVDQQRVAIAVDSGGGYLTCAVTHKAKGEGTPQPILQIPIYPVWLLLISLLPSLTLFGTRVKPMHINYALPVLGRFIIVMKTCIMDSFLLVPCLM